MQGGVPMSPGYAPVPQGYPRAGSPTPPQARPPTPLPGLGTPLCPPVATCPQLTRDPWAPSWAWHPSWRWPGRGPGPATTPCSPWAQWPPRRGSGRTRTRRTGDKYFSAKLNIFVQTTTAGSAPLPCAVPRPLPWVTLVEDSLSTEAHSCRQPRQTTPGRCRPGQAALTVVRGRMSYLENLACQVLPFFIHPNKMKQQTKYWNVIKCFQILETFQTFCYMQHPS